MPGLIGRQIFHFFIRDGYPSRVQQGALGANVHWFGTFDRRIELSGNSASPAETSQQTLLTTPQHG
jgi:hypothetical protein